MNIIGKVAGVRGTVYGSNPLQYGSLASYAYLADGTKISALDTRDSTMTLYRGPFIMRRDSTGTLASTASCCLKDSPSRKGILSNTLPL